MTYTYHATEWRIGIRRKMNDSDTDANIKAIDSLLNYETVKYFSAEEREAERYDRAMARYEDASVKAYTSLAVLNAGQAVIFTCGLAAVMVMCAFEIRAGSKTVGDFVLINAMMIQLYQPLNFMGMVYREIKQAITDIETHVLDSGARAGNMTSAVGKLLPLNINLHVDDNLWFFLAVSITHIKLLVPIWILSLFLWAVLCSYRGRMMPIIFPNFPDC